MPVLEPPAIPGAPSETRRFRAAVRKVRIHLPPAESLLRTYAASIGDGLVDPPAPVPGRHPKTLNDSGHSSSSEQRSARDHPAKPWCREQCAISSRAPGLRFKGSVRRAVCPNSSISRPQPSIDVRHEALTRYLRTLVAAIGLPRRQRNLDGVRSL